MPRLFLLVMILSSLVGDPPPPRHQLVVRTGKAVFLVDALKAKSIPADAEPISRQVVLVEADGSLTPLLPDEASRALFQDERLRNRKTEVTARKIDGLPYLQVVSFKVDEAGVLRIPEYYCDVCSISVRAPQTCPCCQGPMELRMKPESR